MLAIVATLCLLLMLWTLRKDNPRQLPINLAQLASTAVLMALAATLYLQAWYPKDIRRDRNFYGVLTVEHEFSQGLD